MPGRMRVAAPGDGADMTWTCKHCGEAIYKTNDGWRHGDNGLRFCGLDRDMAAPGPKPEKAHARTTDPVTSHEAAGSVKHLRVSQEAVLSAFPSSPLLGMTDQELVSKYGHLTGEGHVPLQSESGVRTRRSELVKKGRLVDSGDRRLTVSGRKSIVWRRT